MKHPTQYNLSNGGIVNFTYSFNSFISGDVVSSIEVEGAAKILPIQDSGAFNDFQVVKGDTAFEVGTEASISGILAGLGTPESDKTVTETYIYDQVHLRTMTFDGLTLVARQALKPADPDLWFIDNAVISSSSFSASRGLIVGMAAADAVREFGTGKFILYIYADTNEPDIYQVDFVNFVGGKHWHGGDHGGLSIAIKDGKVATIWIQFGANED